MYNIIAVHLHLEMNINRQKSYRQKVNSFLWKDMSFTFYTRNQWVSILKLFARVIIARFTNPSNMPKLQVYNSALEYCTLVVC